MQPICICEENVKEVCYCVKCDTEGLRIMDQKTKEWQCPIHHVFMNCGGVKDYLCEKCTKDGWISQAHIGGPVHYIMNTITDERYYKKQLNELF